MTDIAERILALAPALSALVAELRALEEKATTGTGLDATLIVTMRNALITLLDALEQVKAMTTAKEKSCPYAKSDMTPCYYRDGKITEVVIHGRKSCVGCEHSFEWLDGFALVQSLLMKP